LQQELARTHVPRPAPHFWSQLLLTEHSGRQQRAAAVGTVVAKPRSSREKQSRKAFFMRRFSLMISRGGDHSALPFKVPRPREAGTAPPPNWRHFSLEPGISRADAQMGRERCNITIMKAPPAPQAMVVTEIMEARENRQAMAATTTEP